MTADIDYSDLNAPLDGDATRAGKHGQAGGKGRGTMWLRAPAINSLELSIMAMAATEAALQVDIPFIEDDDKPEPHTPEDHRVAQNKSATASLFAEYTTLARSLGPEYRGIFSDFAKLCEAEGLPVLHVNGYRR
jgi:hypothetical protein